MGRKGKGRGRKKSNAARKKTGGQTGRTNSWGEQCTTNRMFKEYYALQKICKDEEDFGKLFEFFGRGLPTTFRFHSGKFNDHLRNKILGELSSGYPVVVTEEEKKLFSGTPLPVIEHPPRPVAWYPGQNAWKSAADRPTIRKVKGLSALRKFLLNENEAGQITRQEEASMIPPFFLDVKPHHLVVDLCAAPGSKTAQLLEFLHQDDASRGLQPPTGFVVANDANSDRAYLLAHQMKRLNSPNLVITNHQAQSFPNLAKYGYGPPSTHTSPSSDVDDGFFDRILADVPCSGDGTLRKSPDIWSKWNVRNGRGLHTIQTRIIERALSLLKVGGQMVYSTCSLNPEENEAVVAHALRRCGDAVELVDASAICPGLKRRPGLTTWKVCMQTKMNLAEKATRDAQVDDESTPTETGVKDGSNPDDILFSFTNPEELVARFGEKKAPRDSVWPPTEEENERFHLNRCMRVLPQDQDTSGFFICVLRKTKPLGKKHLSGSRFGAVTSSTSTPATDVAAATSASATDVGAASSTTASVAATSSSATTASEGIRDDWFLPLGKANTEGIHEYFGIKTVSEGGAFPDDVLYLRAGGGQMINASERKKRKLEQEKDGDRAGKARVVSMVSKEVSEYLLKPNGLQKLHIVAAGCEIYKRNKGQSRESHYRICQSSMKVLLKHITKRKVPFSLRDFALTVWFQSYKCVDPELQKRATKIPGIPKVLLSTELQVLLKENHGAIIAVLDDEMQARFIGKFGEPFAFSYWSGTFSCNALVKNDILTSLLDKMKIAGLLKDQDLVPVDIEALLREHLPELPDKSDSVTK